MKDAVTLFTALGDRLRGFGDDPLSRAVMERSCEANGWFTPGDVNRAVGQIAESMLQRPALAAWLTRYPVPVSSPRRVLVIMAGNIPLVGFFDLLCVVASGHRCLIKPSAKDTALIEYIVELLRSSDPSVPVEFYADTPSSDAAPAAPAALAAPATPAASSTHAPEAAPQALPDAVVAMGGANANRHFRTQYGAVPTLLRSHRQSVAVLSGRETPEQLRALSDDIWAYSGLGCRNVSLIFLPEGSNPKLLRDIAPPPAAVNPKYLNNYRQQRTLLTMMGREFIDLDIAVATEQREFPAALSLIAYTYYKTLAEVDLWLAAHDEELQCVVSTCVTHPCRVDFGLAQSPSLTDYPDRRDLMGWLAALQ